MSAARPLRRRSLPSDVLSMAALTSVVLLAVAVCDGCAMRAR
jgi:hypothetical protein